MACNIRKPEQVSEKFVLYIYNHLPCNH